MIFIELFTHKGALSTEQRHLLSKRLIEVLSEESAPAEVIEAWRGISQVVFHEPDTWSVGGRVVDPTEPPRYAVRVSVPGAWRKEMSAYVISRFTQVLAEADADPQRLYREPHAWVHIIGIPEGSCGAFGQVMRSTDIIKMVTKPFREAPENRIPADKAAPGAAIDPICGMTVTLTDASITLEHEGGIYAFCCVGCRSVFAEQLRAGHLD
jgi:YHS domain-containing protein